MLVLVPTREDVLSIRSIEEAFDLSTTKIRKREVALIRIARLEHLLKLTVHAAAEADDEMIPYSAVKNLATHGNAVSKDVNDEGERQIGINFEGAVPSRRRARAKIGWEERYLIITVHTI